LPLFSVPSPTLVSSVLTRFPQPELVAAM